VRHWNCSRQQLFWTLFVVIRRVQLRTSCKCLRRHNFWKLHGDSMHEFAILLPPLIPFGPSLARLQKDPPSVLPAGRHSARMPTACHPCFRVADGTSVIISISLDEFGNAGRSERAVAVSPRVLPLRPVQDRTWPMTQPSDNDEQDEQQGKASDVKLSKINHRQWRSIACSLRDSFFHRPYVLVFPILAAGGDRR
jgi:hypothetical protein